MITTANTLAPYVAAATGVNTADQNPSTGLITMGTGPHAAADTTAAILRSNYDNWKSMYFPQVSNLMDMTTYNNPGLVDQETTAATNQVNSSFDTARANQANDLARYGLSVDPAAARTTDLAQTAAVVGAKNNTRQYLSDRNRAIAVGGLPSAVAGGTNLSLIHI